MINNSLNAQIHETNVAVIGAGIAGLTAAYRLHQQDIDVHVYEAKNRVGGRIFSVWVNDHSAELGGQGIADGGEAHNLRALIEELGLPLNTIHWHYSLYYEHQEQLIAFHYLLKKFYAENNYTLETLRERLEQVAQQSKNMQDILLQLFHFNKEDLLYKSLCHRLAGYEGAPVEQLSTIYKDTLYYMLCGGIAKVNQEANSYEHVSIKGGNSRLPEAIFEQLPDRVHTNMILRSVTKHDDGRYLLRFADDTIVIADKVVFATPCSVFNDIEIAKNIIPDETLAAIRNVQYGTNAKILVPLRDKDTSNNFIMNGRMSTHFNADSTVLTMYYVGDYGKYDQDSIAELYEEDSATLKATFREAIIPSTSPVIARDERYAQYNTPVGHSWPNDPFIGGSYHIIAPGQEELLTTLEEYNGETVKSLFAPINDQLFFAGEHASVLMDVPGTMEAACESGERVARMIEKMSVTEK